jgi:hypothetical protein
MREQLTKDRDEVNDVAADVVDLLFADDAVLVGEAVVSGKLIVEADTLDAQAPAKSGRASATTTAKRRS